MKRQFTAGAAAKREVKKLSVLLKEVEAGADSIIKDYDKYVKKLVSRISRMEDEHREEYEKIRSHNIDLKVANMKLENDHKLVVKGLKKQLEDAKLNHSWAVEDANFHRQMNEIAAKDEEVAKQVLLDQHKIIQQQGTEIFHLENDLYDMKRKRDGLSSILWALIISIIILLVW